MSRKARKQLLRERDRQRKQREEQVIEQKAQNLKEQVGGFSRTPMTEADRKRIRRSVTLGALQRLADSRVEPIVRTPVPAPGGIRYRNRPTYSGDMAIREAEALAHYEVMKSHTAPIGNKMGYQYVHPESQDALDIKAGLTRRR